MTPARKAALQWFYDRGAICWFRYDDFPPSVAMRAIMERDGQLQRRSQGNFKPVIFSLTDKGRRELNGDIQ
jgi:hypothetical protein